MTINETTAAATRSVEDHVVPAAGTWRVDPGHTSVEFIGRHFMLTKVRGRFNGVEGTVQIGEDPRDSALTVTIDMDSVTSGSAERDAHLRSADFFDVEQHPTATYQSSRVDWHGGDRATVHGELTIVGVTRHVMLEVQFVGGTPDPWGNVRTVFSAKAEIDREDWGLTWNLALETGGILVSKKIQLEIESELILDA
ncbi:YceI family protein [Aquihabitans daechungensis]|uniref:YceI family protein n=1 Tax=Aquihabitans daechungensis TaxID=1052257 RepID=UPI003BA1D6C7